MKKILVVFLTFAMLFLLLACNGNQQTETTNTTTTVTAEVTTTNSTTTTNGDETSTEETTTTTIDPVDITYTIELTGTPFYAESNLYKVSYAVMRGSDGSAKQCCVLVEWNTSGDVAEFVSVYKDHVGTEFPIVAIGRSVLANRTVDEDGKDVFNRVVVKKVVIPENVIEIREDAFCMMDTIESIELNEGLVTISKYAFEGLQNLKEINFPTTLTTIKASAFVGCTSLKKLVIPESVAEIGEMAFFGCRALETIIIPERFKDSMELIFGTVPSGATITYTTSSN